MKRIADALVRMACLVAWFNALAGTYLVNDVPTLEAALNQGRRGDMAPTILVRSGEYEISSQLPIFPGTRLVLEDGAVIKAANGYANQYLLVSRHLDETGSVCPLSGCSHGGYSQFADIEVDGGVWDAGGSLSGRTSAFRFTQGDGLVLTNLSCRNCGRNPIELSGVRNAVIVDACVSASAGLNFGQINGVENVGIAVRNCHFSAIDGNALYVNGGRDIEVSGCSFSDVSGAGLYANAACGFSAIGNSVVETGSYGIRVYQTSSANICSNNVSETGSHAIFVSGEAFAPATNIAVVGNEARCSPGKGADVRIGGSCSGIVEDNFCREGGFSNDSMDSISYVPGAPRFVSVVDEGSGVRVRWERLAAAAEYELQAGSVDGFVDAETYLLSAVNDSCLIPGRNTASLQFRIRARHRYYGVWFVSKWRYDSGRLEVGVEHARTYVVDTVDMLQSALGRAVQYDCYSQAFPLTVRVRPGTYFLSGHLPLLSHTHLILTQDCIMKVAADFPSGGMVVARHLNADGVYCEGGEECCHGGYSQFSDIVVDGGVWEQAVDSTNVTVCVRMTHGRDSVIRNLVCRNSNNHTINLSSSSGMRVENVLIEDTRFASSSSNPEDYKNREAIHCDAAYAEGEDNGFPLDGTVCSNIVISGCSFRNVFAGVGNHHRYDGTVRMGRFEVHDCIFSNLFGWAVWAWDMDDVLVENCTVVDGLFANCMGCKRLKVRDCHAIGDGLRLFESEDVTIVGNEIANSSDFGIYLSSVERFSVVSNSIDGADTYGIRAYVSSNGNISSNVVRRTLRHGIYVSGELDVPACNIQVAGNRCAALPAVEDVFDIRIGLYCQNGSAVDNLCLQRGFSNGSLDEVHYVPGAPSFLSVDMVDSGIATATWECLSGITDYEFQYSESEDFSRLTPVMLQPDETSYSFVWGTGPCFVRIRVRHRYYGTDYLSKWNVRQLTPETTYTVRFVESGTISVAPDMRCAPDAVYALPRVEDGKALGRTLLGWRCSNDRRYDPGVLFFNLAGPGEDVTMVPIWKEASP